MWGIIIPIGMLAAFVFHFPVIVVYFILNFNEFIKIPAVTIATVGHPINPEMRGYMYTDPVTIEDNCWIGAGVTICPGVTIGENSVIGAGSVVVHDIPANSVAAGNPCKVIREINDNDKKYYYKDRPITVEDLAEEMKIRKNK